MKKGTWRKQHKWLGIGRLLHADVLRVRHPAQSSFTHQGCEREQEVPAKSL